MGLEHLLMIITYIAICGLWSWIAGMMHEETYGKTSFKRLAFVQITNFILMPICMPIGLWRILNPRV